ncbi:hypothetical protein OPV22_034200 [Ensete ventricosum]|uniref:Secreted protein n=1 Tax=Ensete ventricosum TaxID=4639 RepID=A0AAV8PP66_ENSVE|nr:hypothetical protein OPV22_034200 [Ensete ventricosum]
MSFVIFPFRWCCWSLFLAFHVHFRLLGNDAKATNKDSLKPVVLAGKLQLLFERHGKLAQPTSRIRFEPTKVILFGDLLPLAANCTLKLIAGFFASFSLGWLIKNGVA